MCNLWGGDLVRRGLGVWTQTSLLHRIKTRHMGTRHMGTRFAQDCAAHTSNNNKKSRAHKRRTVHRTLYRASPISLSLRRTVQPDVLPCVPRLSFLHFLPPYPVPHQVHHLEIIIPLQTGWIGYKLKAYWGPAKSTRGGVHVSQALKVKAVATCQCIAC